MATLATGSCLALVASSSIVEMSEVGMSVATTSFPAAAILLNLVSTVIGSNWSSMAFITHFCRTIRS